MGKARIAEHLQPVGMTLARQQLRRTFVHAFGMLAAQEAAMVEKELQQDQVLGAELSAQEEISAQATVDVLDDRTGANNAVSQVVHGSLKVVKLVAELLAQRRFFLPTERLVLVEGLEIEHFADDGHGNRKLGGEVGQVLVKLGRESQELLAMVFQEAAHGAEAMRAKRFASLEFGEDEAEVALIAAGAATGNSLDQMEKDHIIKVLKETGGNKKKAAEILGIERRTLYNKAKRLGIDFGSI